MKSINIALQERLEIKTPPSEKADVIEKIYAIYSSDREQQIRRAKNVKRKDYTLDKFSIFMHTKVKELSKLYEILSIAKDMEKRNQCFSAWLFWAIKQPK